MAPDTQSRTVPPTVRRAFLAWIAVVACQCLTLLVGFLGSPPGGPTIVPGTGFGVYVGWLVFVVLILAFMVLCAVRMRAGRSWARIALLVIGALYALSTPLLFVQVPVPFATVLTALNAVAIVLAVAAVVLSFLRPANPYFRATQ